MNLKYWEWETAPFKDKVKSPSVRDIARVFFENETQAYRFARALAEVRKRGKLRLSDCPADLPTATWKRYLDYGAQAGLLTHEDAAYELTDRLSIPLKNFALYVREWAQGGKEEDFGVLFALAKKEKQKKRGGRPERQ